MVIYYIKNKVNGKGYVGQHCGNKDNRWKQHLRESLKVENPYPLYRAMRKYGVNNFTYEVLEEIPIELGQRELDLREIYWIHQKNTYIGNKNGYNQTLGGGGGVRSFCQTSGVGEAKFKWGQYDIDGNFIQSWDTPKQAAQVLGHDNYRHLYHAANWHEGKGKYSKTFAGFMWKKVPHNEELPEKITPLNDITKKKTPVLKKVVIPKSSYSEEYEIGQYNFSGDLVNIWPNNAEFIGRSLKMEGDSIRRNLRGESVLTYGFMWKRFKKNEVPDKIPTAPISSSGLSIEKNLFYNEPIIKVDLLTKDIMNKYESISNIPAPFMEQILIYSEAISKKNIDNDHIFWVFEKDYNNNFIYETRESFLVHHLLKILLN